MTYTTQELIDECTKWIGEANTPDMAEFVTALMDRLLAEQGLIDALEEINKINTYNAESYGVYAQIARRAMAKWKDA